MQALLLQDYIASHYAGWRIWGTECVNLGGTPPYLNVTLISTDGEMAMDSARYYTFTYPDLQGQCSGDGSGVAPPAKPPVTPVPILYSVTGFVYLYTTLAPEYTVILTTTENSTVILEAPIIPNYEFIRWERHVSDFKLPVSFLPSFSVDVAYADLQFYAVYISSIKMPETPTPTPEASLTPSPTPTPTLTPTPGASLTPTPTPTPTLPLTPTPTPNITPSASSFVYPTPTPSPTEPIAPPPPSPSRLLVTPTPSPRFIEVGDALLVSRNLVEFVYDKGSFSQPTLEEIQLTNRFSDSSLMVTITSPYVYPDTLSLGPNETKTIILRINSIDYLESLPLGDTLGLIPVSVVRTLAPTPIPSPPPPPPSATPSPTPPASPIPEPVLGCMDPTAANYNALATQNTGCIYLQSGCRDPKALNFDSTADVETPGSCRYEISIRKVSGDGQTVTQSSGLVPLPLVMEVVQVDADTGTTTPVADVPISIATNGSTATISGFNSTANITSANSDPNGILQVTWMIDTLYPTPQVRFAISSATIPPQYVINAGVIIFSATNGIQQITRTPTPTPTPTPTMTPSRGYIAPPDPDAPIMKPVLVSAGPWPNALDMRDTFTQLLAQRPLNPVVQVSFGTLPPTTGIYPNASVTISAPVGSTVYLNTYQPTTSVWEFWGWVDGHTTVNSVGNTVFTTQPDLNTLPPDATLDDASPPRVSFLPAFSYIVPTGGLNLYAVYVLPLDQIPPIIDTTTPTGFTDPATDPYSGRSRRRT